MATKSKTVDSLAERVLVALQQEGMDESWVEDKRYSLRGQSRIEVLDWISCSLDGGNMCVAAETLGITVQDLQALQRVMQKIRWA